MQTYGVSTTTTDTAAASQKSRTDLGQKDIFLKLLVAQMKYQDPQKPQDPTQMASQLAQFNMVEQQTNTNTLLNQLLANGGVGSSGSSASLASASWLGHTVTVNQGQVHYDGATPQNLNVNLTGNAATGYLNITDANGNPVRTVNIAGMTMGDNAYTWDGLMDNGAPAPVGDYSIQASATDLNGQSLSASISRTGIVEAVRFLNGGNELVVGGMAVATSDITEIRP